MYYTEQLLPKIINESSFSTQNPDSANFFLVPHYSTCYYHDCVFEQNEEPENCKIKTSSYLREIFTFVKQTQNYWNMTAGTNHLFIFSWDQGSEILSYYSPLRDEIRDAIHLTTLGSVRFIYLFIYLFLIENPKKKKMQIKKKKRFLQIQILIIIKTSLFLLSLILPLFSKKERQLFLQRNCNLNFSFSFSFFSN